MGILDGSWSYQGVQAPDECEGGTLGDVSDSFYGNWSVQNTGIATADYYGTHTAVSVGSTRSNTSGYYNSNDPRLGCPLSRKTPSGNDNVAPTLSLGNALFYNGGLALPSTFTEAATSAVVTANGGGSGSYSWSLSSSSGSIASFSSSTIVTTTTTSGNTVTVYAAGASRSHNDLTISLAYTPSGGSPLTSTTTTAIDSPYQLSFVSQSPLAGAQTCGPFVAGNKGWETQFTWEMLSYFGSPLFGMDLNEQFTGITIYQSPGYGYKANGTPGASGVANFTDTYCAALNPDGSITTMPPQNPLLTDAVDSATQTYRLGSTSIGSGTSVQTQTLTRFRDHITVTNIAR